MEYARAFCYVSVFLKEAPLFMYREGFLRICVPLQCEQFRPMSFYRAVYRAAGTVFRFLHPELS